VLRILDADLLESCSGVPGSAFLFEVNMAQDAIIDGNLINDARPLAVETQNERRRQWKRKVGLVAH
jgi:hypothetical protein